MTEPKPVPEFVVYGRPGCHLCEKLVEDLMPLLRGRGSLEVRNIDGDPALKALYGTRIPVVESAGVIVCEGRLNLSAVDRALRAAGTD